jgi:hypothetical protein
VKREFTRKKENNEMSTKWFFRSLVTSVLLLCASAAAAQTQGVDAGKLAMAQKLYEQATSLMDAQKYADACPKLEQVTELVPSGLGGHEALGQCYEALGRFGSAWEQYTVAESLAHSKSESQRAVDMAAKAKALEPKVAKITIGVPKELQDVDGLTISRDGKNQEKALWNTPLPVDTGAHVIKVQAPGRIAWSKEVMVLADGAMLTVELPQLVVDPPVLIVDPFGQPRLPQRTWQKPLAWTSMGIGAATLITSGVLSGLAVGKKNESNTNGYCREGDICDETGLKLRAQALGLANGATATVVIGGVLAAGGIVLLATAPKQEERKRAGMQWSVEVAPFGVGLLGTW